MSTVILSPSTVPEVPSGAAAVLHLESQTEAPILKASSESAYKYARFLPTFDPSIKLPPLEPFEHVDPGKLDPLV